MPFGPSETRTPDSTASPLVSYKDTSPPVTNSTNKDKPPVTFVLDVKMRKPTITCFSATTAKNGEQDS